MFTSSSRKGTDVSDSMRKIMLNEHIAFKVMEVLQKETLNLYALVDGLEYDRLFQKEITQDETSLPLFIQPNNQDIAFAGPWLFNIIFNTNSLQNQIIQLEQITHQLLR